MGKWRLHNRCSVSRQRGRHFSSTSGKEAAASLTRRRGWFRLAPCRHRDPCDDISPSVEACYYLTYRNRPSVVSMVLHGSRLHLGSHGSFLNWQLVWILRLHFHLDFQAGHYANPPPRCFLAHLPWTHGPTNFRLDDLLRRKRMHIQMGQRLLVHQNPRLEALLVGWRSPSPDEKTRGKQLSQLVSTARR